MVRAGPEGLPEVFMVRRSPRSRFAADAYVFPGGAVDQADCSSPHAPQLTPAEAYRRLTERGSDPPATPDLGLGFYIAAIRELYEEAGILLARHAGATDGPLDAAICTLLAELRSDVQASSRDFSVMLQDLGLELAPEGLIYFSHWITPESSPIRFDTRFFMMEDRPEQAASHCGVETIDGLWTTPSALLRRAEAGDVTLVSVTAEHLRVLAQVPSVSALLEYARTRKIRTVLGMRTAAGWDLGGGGSAW